MVFFPSVRTLPHRVQKPATPFRSVRPGEKSWIGGETSPADHNTELRRFQTWLFSSLRYERGAVEGADWCTGNLQADMMNWFKMIRGNKWLPDHRTASPQHRGVMEAVWD